MNVTIKMPVSLSDQFLTMLAQEGMPSQQAAYEDGFLLLTVMDALKETFFKCVARGLNARPGQESIKIQDHIEVCARLVTRCSVIAESWGKYPHMIEDNYTSTGKTEPAINFNDHLWLVERADCFYLGSNLGDCGTYTSLEDAMKIVHDELYPTDQA
jgi:hypothetical protein